MAVTTTKASPSGRHAWQIFERPGDTEDGVVVICESLNTFTSIYVALLAGQAVLQSILDDYDD
ncbi:MAG: hypothetical protein EOO27_10655 [Comamonadaceae bacterium]|nr:MAG: hypothetical protein EOO27_10655 [Comamonadaceae bacterium]